ncbi:MAG: hypothetical protein IJ109_02080 [Firmicutes bacterium]|nr:hypothetical protein [Bacillota bacterium]
MRNNKSANRMVAVTLALMMAVTPFFSTHAMETTAPPPDVTAAQETDQTQSTGDKVTPSKPEVQTDAEKAETKPSPLRAKATSRERPAVVI